MPEKGDEKTLLMPLETLALLGAGSQGAAAIANYRVKPENFDDEFSELSERLAAEGDDEAAVKYALASVIMEAAREASGWFSVSSDEPNASSAIMLVGEPAVLIAILHGPVVEWVIGEEDLVMRFIEAVLTASPDAHVQLALFDEELAIAGALFKGGSVDVAARDPEQLAKVSSAAQYGLSSLLNAMVALVKLQSS